MLKAAVSGSFHRHMSAIATAVNELTELGVRVLSPADPRIVDAHGEFLFVASDRVRSVRLVQDRHMEAIRSGDFLWLVCPDGYVGQSASMEIGFAAGAGVQIFATNSPADLTLREYVTIVSTLDEAVTIAGSRSRPPHDEGILIDPHASIEEAHRILHQLDNVLNRVNPSESAARRVHRGMTELQTKLCLPTYLH